MHIMCFIFLFCFHCLSGMPMPNPNIGMPMPNPVGLYGAAPSMPQPGGGYPGNLSFGVSILIWQASTVNLHVYTAFMYYVHISIKNETGTYMYIMIIPYKSSYLISVTQ